MGCVTSRVEIHPKTPATPLQQPSQQSKQQQQKSHSPNKNSSSVQPAAQQSTQQQQQKSNSKRNSTESSQVATTTTTTTQVDTVVRTADVPPLRTQKDNALFVTPSNAVSQEDNDNTSNNMPNRMQSNMAPAAATGAPTVSAQSTARQLAVRTTGPVMAVPLSHSNDNNKAKTSIESEIDALEALSPTGVEASTKQHQTPPPRQQSTQDNSSPQSRNSLTQAGANIMTGTATTASGTGSVSSTNSQQQQQQVGVGALQALKQQQLASLLVMRSLTRHSQTTQHSSMLVDIDGTTVNTGGGTGSSGTGTLNSGRESSRSSQLHAATSGGGGVGGPQFSSRSVSPKHAAQLHHSQMQQPLHHRASLTDNAAATHSGAGSQVHTPKALVPKDDSPHAAGGVHTPTSQHQLNPQPVATSANVSAPVAVQLAAAKRRTIGNFATDPSMIAAMARVGNFATQNDPNASSSSASSKTNADDVQHRNVALPLKQFAAASLNSSVEAASGAPTTSIGGRGSISRNSPVTARRPSASNTPTMSSPRKLQLASTGGVLQPHEPPVNLHAASSLNSSAATTQTNQQSAQPLPPVAAAVAQPPPQRHSPELLDRTLPNLSARHATRSTKRFTQSRHSARMPFAPLAASHAAPAQDTAAVLAAQAAARAQDDEDTGFSTSEPVTAAKAPETSTAPSSDKSIVAVPVQNSASSSVSAAVISPAAAAPQQDTIAPLPEGTGSRRDRGGLPLNSRRATFSPSAAVAAVPLSSSSSSSISHPASSSAIDKNNMSIVPPLTYTATTSVHTSVSVDPHTTSPLPPPHLTTSLLPNASANTSRRSTARGKKLAFVCDNTSITQRLVSVALFSLGYTVTALSSGEELLAQLARKPVPHAELFVLDMLLSGMGGLDCVRALRAHESKHDLLPALVVAHTASCDSESLHQFAMAGCDAACSKGCLLAEAVQCCVDARRARPNVFVHVDVHGQMHNLSMQGTQADQVLPAVSLDEPQRNKVRANRLTQQRNVKLGGFLEQTAAAAAV